MRRSRSVKSISQPPCLPAQQLEECPTVDPISPIDYILSSPAIVDEQPTVPIENASFRNDYPYYEYSQIYHGATDLAAPVGTPILATFSGEVIASEIHWSYGINVVIKSTIENKEYISIYAHMDSKASIAWDVGNYVSAGQVIGYVGMTGNTDGPHLHFEMREYPFIYKDNNVDPRQFLN